MHKIFFPGGEVGSKSPSFERLLPRHKIFCPQWPVLGFFLLSGLLIFWGLIFLLLRVFKKTSSSADKIFSCRGEGLSQSPVL